MRVFAPKYYNDFSCIGSDCEASCCEYRWNIDVDKSHYKKLKKAHDGSKQDRKLFKEIFKRRKGNNIIATDDNYAVIKKDVSGSCGYLTKDRWCGLAIRFGDKFLPDVCNDYPRINSAVRNQKIEAALTLSCPEAARKCLLDDRANEMAEVDLKSIDKNGIRIRNMLDLNANDYYSANIDLIKDISVSLLSDDRFPLKTRLFLITFFANKSKDFFYRGVTSDPVKKLTDLYMLINSDETKKVLHDQLKSIQIPSEIGMGIIQEGIITHPKISHSFTWAFAKLYGKVMLNVREQINLASEAQITNNIETNRKEMGLFWQFYLLRKSFVGEDLVKLIERRLTNYCVHYWMTNWHDKSENLLMHMRLCLSYKAIVSFLFYSHPSLNIFQEENLELSCQEKNKIIDDTLVEVVYSFSRDNEKQDGIIKLFESHLNKKQMTEFAPVMLLIDF